MTAIPTMLDNRVADLLTDPPRAVRLVASLREVAIALAEDDIGLVLVEHPTGYVAGVVSERDLVRALAEGADLDGDRVPEIMSDDILEVPFDATLADATTVMANGTVRHVVVKDGAETVGVISARDVLAAVAFELDRDPTPA